MDYKNGKIYKIQTLQTDKFYIGSTAMPRLCQRLAKHMSNFRAWNKNNENMYCTSYEILQYKDHNIVLLEDYSCLNKDQLHAREEFWRLQYKDKCVNKLACFRSEEKIIEYQKEYYQKNKTELDQKKREYYVKNKVKMCDNASKYRNENKNIIYLRKKTQKKCDICGATPQITNWARHLQSKKHLSAMNS